LDETELINHLTVAIDKVRQDELLKQKEVNADGVKEIMSMMDDNGDGKLSKEEMFGKTTQSSKQAIADNRMFDFADGAFGNKDGELDEDEIFIMALPQYSADRKGWFKFKAQDHMEEMDTNGDNEVSFQEYSDAMELATGGYDEFGSLNDPEGIEDDAMKKMFPNHKENTKRILFNKADRNGDKKLDLEELTRMIIDLEFENMVETVESLIAIGDDNGDEKLSLNEIIAHVSDFGGHMAFFLNDPQLLFPTKGHGGSVSPLNVNPKERKKFVSNALAENRKRVNKGAVLEQVGRHIINKLPMAQEVSDAIAADEAGVPRAVSALDGLNPDGR